MDRIYGELIQMKLSYFAYGSNLPLARLQKRVPSARLITTGYLWHHDLRFHKISKKDGSAKCDAFYTGSCSDYIIGAVYEIDSDHKKSLDDAEGLGKGYEEKEVIIISRVDQKRIKAITYVATMKDSKLRPFCWYMHHVLCGVKEHRFPQHYVEKIRAVEFIDDHDRDREREELSIYEK